MAATNTTTTSTTTTSTSQGLQLQVQTQSNTVTVGNFVTDVSLQPYMAPTVIGFYAYNMRPNQRIHVFFNSILVDQYCAPGVIPALQSGGSGNNSISLDTSTANTVQLTGTWGTPIVTDSQGHVAGQFNVPAGVFQTGDHVIELADVTSLSQGNDAITTSASASYTASNLSVTKQVVTLTTVNPILSVVPVVNTVSTTTTTNVHVTTIPDIVNLSYYYEPIAQGLTINTPDNSAGVFAISLDLFFKQGSLISNNGVTVYLCEINNGYPDGSSILPFSTVHLNYNEITTSSTANVATRFTFESPVFLNNGTEYAFIVKPDNNDPDIQVYSANLGDIDITTGVQVYSQPIVGTAFYGSTMNEWTALQTEYIKFNLNVAKFSSGIGDVYFNNHNVDYLSVYGIGYSNLSSTVLPGDTVFSASNSTPNTVNTSINGVLKYYDSVKGLFYVDNSTGNFGTTTFLQVHRFANSALAANSLSNSSFVNTSTLVAYANVAALYNPVLNDIVGQFSYITPSGTSVNYDYTGVNNTYSYDSNTFPIQTGLETEFYDQERVVLSRTNEVTNIGGNNSMTIHARLTTDSQFISPLIDTVKNNTLIIRNLVDWPQISYNEFFNNGPSRTKYISQIVTLAAGQDSEDLQIILSAHRPPGTDIKVYVKFLNGQDTDPMSIKTWTPMFNQGDSVFCDPSNPYDVREFTYSTYGYYNLVPTSGFITASNTNTTITGVNTLFGQENQVGNFINMMANSSFGETARQIVSIANTTSLTLNAPFNGNYSSNAYYVVVPPTTAYMSTSSNTALTGTVTVSNTSNIITGSGTNFTGQLMPGNIIGIDNDEQVVVSIANATYLTVGTSWSDSNTGTTAYLVTPQGLTYQNAGGSLYTLFKQFQIKVILQAQDSSKVPLVDSLQALALQL